MLAGLLISPGGASAHALSQPLRPAELWHAWTFEPGVAVLLALAAGAYGFGLARLWRSAGVGRGIRRSEAVAFAAGWLTLVVALVSPLHAMGDALFSAHMAQHTLLIAVAAPLLIFGRANVALMWTLSPRRRSRVAPMLKSRAFRRTWEAAAAPVNAWALFAIALWLWHAPALYEASIGSDAVHAVQHACFLGTSLLFWHTFLHRLSHRRGAGIAFIFTTAIHSAALGALITLASAPWYPMYEGSAAIWGTSALRDQQLAGWIMWIPAGIVYLAALLVAAAAWMRESEVRVARRTARLIAPVLLLLLLPHCDPGRRDQHEIQAMLSTGGDPDRGKAAIRTYGCGACHTIHGIPGAQGSVGPSLDGVAGRAYIAGVIENSPDNLVRWIRNPKSIDPKTAMPVLGVGEADARDIAAYLYWLRLR